MKELPKKPLNSLKGEQEESHFLKITPNPLKGGLKRVLVNGEYDDVRSEALNHIGVKIIRFTNQQILEQIDEIEKQLEIEINLRISELSIKAPFQGVGGYPCQDGGEL